MDEYTFTIADYAVFVSMLVVSAAIGAYYAWLNRSKKADKTDFLVGNRDTSVLPMVLSMTASVLSAITVLGTPSEIMTHSTQYWTSILAIVVAAVVTDRIFLHMFYENRFTSINKYLQRRSRSNALRLITSFSYILGNLLYLGAVLYGPALALSAVTPISVDTSIITVGIVCTFYTSFGGMKAVVWTDVIQMIIMFVGLLLVAIRGSYLVGGVANVFNIAYEENRIQVFSMKTDVITGVPTLWEILLGFMAHWTSHFSTNQLCVQRYCAAPTIQKARAILYYSIPSVIITVSTASYCGLVLYANYYKCDPSLTGQITKVDQYMPHFVVEHLGSYAGLPGLFVAAVFSGSLSSISSVLNAVTTLTWDDFLKRYIITSKVSKEMWVLKITCLVYGFIAIGSAFLAKHMGSIIQTNFTLTGSVKGPLLGVFLVSALSQSANPKGLIAGLISGQATCLALVVLCIIYPKPKAVLPTTTEECFGNYTTYNKFQPVNVEDVYWFHYISSFLVPFIGNIITVIVTIVVSKLTGGNKDFPVDQRYISPLVRKNEGSIENIKPEEVALKNSEI